MFPFRRSLYLMLTFSGHRVNQMPLGCGFRLVGATGGIAVFQQIMPTSTSPKANAPLVRPEFSPRPGTSRAHKLVLQKNLQSFVEMIIK